MNKKLSVWLVCCAALAVSACHDQVIPNTEIPDNDDNRAIIAFCERYRHAIEDRNVGLLLSLASQRYFDNSGTPTADDDIDRTGLERVLTDRFKELKAMRYEIKYRNVFEAVGVVYVEYTYNMAFQYKIGEKTKWSNRTADNRLELERVADGFLILTGM